MQYDAMLKDYVVDMEKIADLKYPDKELKLTIDQSIHKEKILALSGFSDYFDQGMLLDWFMGDEKACIDFISQFEQKLEKDMNSKKANLISERTLGEYFPSLNAIVIYEKPCMIVSRALNCAIEKLISVVIAHEVAHSVTHLGLDRYRGIWNNYDRALEKDKELFAQIYPYMLFSNPRYNELMTVFQNLCGRQSEIYNNWKELKDHDTGAINEELIRIRRKQASVDDRRDENLIDEVHDDINKSRNIKSKRQSTKKTACNGEDNNYPKGGVPYRAPVPLSDKYNVIPGNVQNVCRQVLIVEIRSDDDIEKRILQALVHIYSHCPGINRYVFFKADKWDINAWQRHASSFKGVRVHLNFNQVHTCELRSISSAGSLPWNQKTRNRKIITDINKWLSVNYASELQAGIIEEDFTLLRNSESNIATSRCVIIRGYLRLPVQCYIDGLNYGFSVERNSIDKFSFANLAESLEKSFYFQAQDKNHTILVANGYVEDYKELTAIVLDEYMELINIILQWEADPPDLHEENVPF